MRETGDRQHPLGHARVAKRREDVPEQPVDAGCACRRRGRPGRARRRRARRRASRAAVRSEEDEAGDREQRRQPAEEDERLGPVARVPGDEVEPGRRVDLHLRERAAALVDRAVDHGQPDEDAREDRGDDADRRLEERPVRRASGRTRRGGRTGSPPSARCTWPGEGDRDEGQARKPPPALVVGPPRPLERPQRERQQERDRAEQVAAALREAVGRDLEREPARGRREPRERRARAARASRARPAPNRQSSVKRFQASDRPEERRRAASRAARTATRPGCTAGRTRGGTSTGRSTARGRARAGRRRARGGSRSGGGRPARPRRARARRPP